ncbi:MAG: hypothetical protein ACRD2U_07380 [Terriglobales bacterium]
MQDTFELAIVAALEREVRPLVKNWRAVSREYDGRRYKFFERDRTVVVCGGIGAEAARRATEAMINLYQPARIRSAGFAGALNSKLKAGDIFIPSCVIDAKDGSRAETGQGNGMLLTAPIIAGPAQKSKFAQAYGAEAIDMEAAAVARGAQSHGISFDAVKSISDESHSELPPVDRFIGDEGQFLTFRFGAFTAIRPWLWIRTFRLARNSAKASRALCHWLDQAMGQPEKNENPQFEAHPISGTRVKGSGSV